MNKKTRNVNERSDSGEPETVSPTSRKTYVVHVREEWVFSGEMKIEAESQWEAEEIAADRLEGDWNQSDCLEREICILTEDEQSVAWSEEAFNQVHLN